MKFWQLSIICLLSCFVAVSANDMTLELCRHGHLSMAAGAESSTDRKYAPDRKVDIIHLAIDVTPDFEKRTLQGEVTLTFKPIGKPLDQLRLDGVELTVQSVVSNSKVEGYNVTDKEIVVTFANAIPVGRETKLSIKYAAQPKEGLYFRTAATGYPAEEAHIWTQGETSEARHWFPCYDYPNAKFTSEVTCRVPEGMTVLSNGRQVSSTKDPATGLVAVRWLQDKPHVSYLITLLAGKFVTLEDRCGDILLRFYTLPCDAPEARLSFADTKPAMEFFQREIGIPYPWAQYGQVVVRDFLWGGMENTTLTTLTDRTLHRANTETLTSSEGLVSHELAHQWFGDYVTCKDWSQVWLNEGFATYYANLFAGNQHGRDELLYGLYRDSQHVLSQTNGAPKAIVFRRYGKAWEQFDYRAYPKGGWVLHMLRSQLGDDLYRKCIQTYLQRHAFGVVVTQDLNAVIEELSARSFDQFFDQWVYHARQPELDVTYSWDDKTKLAKVTIRQIQPINDDVLLFRFPLKLRFKSGSTVVDHRVEVKEKEEDFYVPLKQAPQIVRIDPEFTLLAKINFKPPKAMVYAQLADSTDMIGRLMAADQLADKDDHETVAKLKDALNRDGFYAVRAKASESLRKIHNDEALEALIASLKQDDARARNAVVNDIGGFYHQRTLETLLHVAEREQNPAIVAAAVKGLGAYQSQAVRDVLKRLLNSDSYRQRIAEAAIAAMRAQDEPSYIVPLRETLKRREAAFTSFGFSAGLEAIGFLARNDKNRDEVRDFLASYLNHKREWFRLAAMRALGLLEDPKSIPLLQTFASASTETRQQQEAEKAIAALRAVNKPTDNLKDLRQDMLDMQKETRNLKKELQDLTKRTESDKKKH